MLKATQSVYYRPKTLVTFSSYTHSRQLKKGLGDHRMDGFMKTKIQRQKNKVKKEIKAIIQDHTCKFKSYEFQTTILYKDMHQ